MNREKTLIGEIDDATFSACLAHVRRSYTVTNADALRAQDYVDCSCEDNDPSGLTVAEYMQQYGCHLGDFHECPTDEAQAWD